MRRHLLAALLLLPLAGQAQPLSGHLTLYTSQPEADAAGTLAAFRAAHPGVTTEFVRGGTGQILPRIRAELAAGAPRADVLLLADSLTMEGLKAGNRLLRVPDMPKGGVPAALVDPDGAYWGTKLITTGLLRNTRAPLRPARWADLLAPEYRGQVATPAHAVSGAALIHLLTLIQQPALGWSYLERLAAQDVRAAGGNGQVMQAVTGGERAYGVIIDYLPIRERAKGATVEFVFPEDGVSAVTEPVAILAGTRNPAAARAFVAFLLSAEGQRLAAAQGYLPADPAMAPPPGFPPPQDIRVMPFDPARAAAESEPALRRFNALFGG